MRKTLLAATILGLITASPIGDIAAEAASLDGIAHAEECSHGKQCPPDDAWYTVLGRTGRCQAMATDTNTPDLFIKKLTQEGDPTVQSRPLVKDGKLMGVMVRTKDTVKFRGFTSLFVRGLSLCQDIAAGR